MSLPRDSAPAPAPATADALAPAPLRHLVIVLGDQLDEASSALDGFDPAHDALWMAEVAEESTHVWSAKARIAVFLAAMRHFAQAQRALGRCVLYTALDAHNPPGTLAGQLQRAIEQHRPQALVLAAPGDWRVLQALRAVARGTATPLDLRDDRHFLLTVREFSHWAQGRAQLRLEYFYREMRRRTGLLMRADGQSEGGRWNFDADNRAAFPASGPGVLPPPPHFAPDATTREVLALVEQAFPQHPGSTQRFSWPLTRAQALQALEAFIRERLPRFGQHQDALWAGEPWLYHSLLSVALNLKLLHPLEVARAAEAAWQRGEVPLASAEGFIRQVIGWREYARGIYWTQMPGYAERNALDATAELPAFYWSGDTPMACLRDVITQTLALGYAHHIQRLMVTGLYALLLGVRPQAVHQWYLAVYVDAVEWVELPNTLGMSQFADGGLMASKPYAASGKYIQRMGNHCQSCRFKPDERTGPSACPFTTLYWDFLLRHEQRLAGNPRMAMQLRNLARLGEAQRSASRAQADAHRREVGGA